MVAENGDERRRRLPEAVVRAMTRRLS